MHQTKDPDERCSFFPDSYFRRVASLIPGCRMAVFTGAPTEFIAESL